MNQEMISNWERNLKAMTEERSHLAAYQVRADRERSAHEIQVARASAPVVNVTIRRYD